MTQPDLNLYPDEFEKIAVALTKLANAFEFTHFTDTNKAIFNIAAVNIEENEILNFHHNLCQHV